MASPLSTGRRRPVREHLNDLLLMSDRVEHMRLSSVPSVSRCSPLMTTSISALWIGGVA
jgi:hypothetical protein